MSSPAAGSFGARLRACRRSAGLSQEELAEGSGLSVRAIRDLERGRTQWPYRDSLHRLADALELRDAARAGFLGAADRRLAPADGPRRTRPQASRPARHPGPPHQRAGGAAVLAGRGARLRRAARPAGHIIAGAARAGGHRGGHRDRRHRRGREDLARGVLGASGGRALPRRAAVREPARVRPIGHSGDPSRGCPRVPGRPADPGGPDARHAGGAAGPVPQPAGRPADAGGAGQRAGRGAGAAAAARRTDLPGRRHQPQPAHRPGGDRGRTPADAGRTGRRRGP